MADVKPRRIEGPTPQRGVYALIYYRDADGAPCERSEAAEAEIHECDADGEVIARTYATLKRRN